MSTDKFSNYLTLLNIRRKAFRLAAIITGANFFLAMAFTILSLLLMQWDGQSLFLLVIFDILAGIGFIMAMVRFEINKEKIDLLNQLWSS